MEEKNTEGFDLFRVFKIWRWRHTIVMIIFAIATYFWITEWGPYSSAPTESDQLQ